ncbi:hypothetical protein BB934_39065 (plasmid) [Microvirga ossetica]|uniref:Uncharacterized protein n=1 Tax=Microvirga ossetica TaxID=1882682 RepID=A0A1B2EXY9_9HYPH|nr:hypothetical protein BB934_39065 [Microvirga ossetica]
MSRLCARQSLYSVYHRVFRFRDTGEAPVTLDRVEHDATDLEDAKVRALSLFETLDMPQTPDAMRILDHNGDEVFAWGPERPSA